MAHDYPITGAGPAGVQLAALLERDGRDYAVLERGTAPGTSFTPYPRHRTLISINKAHTGYSDPEQRLRRDWNSCRPAPVIDDRFPEQTSALESTTVPGPHFAGTITQSGDFKRSASGFIHGFRYGVRALHRVLAARHHDAPWPSTDLAPSAEAISDALPARVNRSSALWQQFAVIGDVVTVSDDVARYREEVPVAYVADGGLGPAEHRFVATPEHGPDHDSVDPFDVTIPRVAENDAANAHDASYLHPVVRHYRDGALAATHHLAENLENHWDLPAVHQQPPAAFVKECLADA